MIVLMLKLKIKMLSVIPNKFQLLFVYHLVILDYEEITRVFFLEKKSLLGKNCSSIIEQKKNKKFSFFLKRTKPPRAGFYSRVSSWL